MMNASYRGMDRAALDLAYNNVRAELGYQSRMERFRERSDLLYRQAIARRDIAYGDQPRQRFDWLSCGEGKAPSFVFVHGGYWQNYTKEDLAFIARGPLSRGFNVVLAEYTLAPDATMTQIVGEIGQMLDFLDHAEGEIGFGDRPVCLCGHSAGGQLAMLHRAHPAVTATLAISALFDLEPIALSWLNEKLRLTGEDVARYSPIRQIMPGAPMVISVGQAELPELIRQSHDYAEACKKSGEHVSLLTLPGQTHFSILEDLANAEGALLSAVAPWIGHHPWC